MFSFQVTEHAQDGRDVQLPSNWHLFHKHGIIIRRSIDIFTWIALSRTVAAGLSFHAHAVLRDCNWLVIPCARSVT